MYVDVVADRNSGSRILVAAVNLLYVGERWATNLFCDECRVLFFEVEVGRVLCLNDFQRGACLLYRRRQYEKVASFARKNSTSKTYKLVSRAGRVTRFVVDRLPSIFTGEGARRTFRAEGVVAGGRFCASA